MPESNRKTAKTVPIESDWVAGIRAGSGADFEKLFRLYCQPLINFARRYVGERETAENLVQDVFLKIWENRAQLNPDLNIKNYLYTAVKNQALRHLRHRKVELKNTDNPKLPEPASMNPEDQLSEKELAESIQDAIARLPEKCRIVFSMNRFDGLTYSEIANIQSISIKTVETQMGRALKSLRKHLAPFLSVFPF